MPADQQEFIEINARLAAKWPNINTKIPGPPDAQQWEQVKDKKQYLEEYDIKQLKDFCDIFGAEPWFAVRFARKDWLFLSLEDIEKTENGYVIDSKVAERRGLLLDELIK